MSWTSLPPELLNNVLSNKALGKRDFVNLVWVNKHTRLLALQYLYRDVKLFTSRGRPDQRVLNLFDRSLTESPRLAAAIKSLAITTFLPDDDSLARTKTILGKISALQNLSLSFYGKNYFDACFLQKIIPGQPEHNGIALAHVQCIEISHPGLTLAGISSLILLPKIQRLAVTWHRTEQSSGAVSSPSTTAHRSSSLRELTITTSGECSDELHTVLLSCPVLESFTCNVTLMRNPDDSPVSPAGLSQALMPCQKTLVTMDLNCTFNGHIDDTGLDLSCFDNVRFLKVNSLLLLEYDERHEPALRGGLYTRLPSRLERLEV